MENNNKIEFNSTPSYGYNLSRTSYDIHQEINAKVIGVLKYNNDIRKKLLSRNIGQYNQVPHEEGIGYISNIYSNISNKPFPLGENGLLGYTHLDNTPLQEKVHKKYDLDDVINHYRINPNTDERNFRWNGHFYNYIDYFNDVLGFPITIFDIASNINNTNKTGIVSSIVKGTNLPNTPCALDALNFLATHTVLNDLNKSDLKSYMDSTRIGVIKPQPMEVLTNNKVTTNISNFSGIDTRLGLISNEMYANVLYSAAEFNTARNTKYITPDVYETIGNKLNTISTLSSDYRINPDTGRLAYDLSGVYHDMDTYQEAVFRDYKYKDGRLGLGYDTYKSKKDSAVGSIEDMESDVVFTDLNFDFNEDVIDNNHARLKNLRRNKLNFKNIYKDYFEEYQIGKFYNPIYEKNVRALIDNPLITSDTISEEIFPKSKSGGLDLTTLSIFKSKYLEKIETENEKKLSKLKTNTIISRFYTGVKGDEESKEITLLQSAIDNKHKKYGLSHGRNLLTKKTWDGGKPDDIHYNDEGNNVHDNPYCRVWTWGYQYDKINKLIRPFSKGDRNNGVIIGVDELQKDWYKYGRREGSAERLKDNSVLNRNGFVNITPVSEEGKDGQGNTIINFINETKKCMFSIENLAWKDITKVEGTTDISKEQIGPNGGRIMWFPPYGLSFNENVSVNWSPNDFIGRGERIYGYTNTERTGTLSFILLVDNPSVIDMWRKNNGLINDEDKEQTLLRFFAGCEVLEFNNKEDKQGEKIPKTDPEPDKIPPHDDNFDMVFYIFFPNNCSGYELTKDKKVNEDMYEGVRQFLYGSYERKGGEGYNGLTPVYIGTDYKWCYFVDNDTIDHKLIYDNNYQDTTKYGLNEDLKVVHANSQFKDATHTYYDIVEMIGSENLFIESAIIKGFASSHGNNKKQDVNEVRNNKLSKQRAKFAKHFLEKHFNVDPNKIKIDDNGIINVDDIDANNVSGESAKRARCAQVKLKVKRGETIGTVELEAGESAEVGNKDKKVNIEGSRVVNGTKSISEEEFKKVKSKRWDYESEYFTLLQDNDPFQYQRIIDKIKYFNPAYHSITPEGFNARLGFLHQCTRQGPTLGVSDVKFENHSSAGNLAFGRPPICVLRLGDFYNTKILITSMTIDFENSQWDLNPEGIGVQPLFAKVSLNIIFLGGSDLTAPISRLQNAVSFNYYANQSIYDDRADIGMYNGTKAKIKGTPWKPNMDTGKALTNNDNNNNNSNG